MNEEKDIPKEDRWILCRWCNGTGENWSGSGAGCPKCGGLGEIPNPKLKEEE